MTESKDYSNMLRVGTLLHGTYRIDKYLASGGFGNTYEATNMAFNEKKAIKEFFMPDFCSRSGDGETVTVGTINGESIFASQLGKFKKEARRIRKLHSNNIVQVYDLFEENGTAYYVMDYIDGESLSERLKRNNRPINENEVKKILPQILNALDAAHEEGIWHLDLKPANIMLDRQGVVKLIDFGASKQQKIDGNGATTDTTSIAYTPGFAPIEQVEQNIDEFGPWTDFYALGATLYTLLTNKRPPSPSKLGKDHSDDKHEVLLWTRNTSTEMKNLITWMMAYEPQERPKSVDNIRQFIQSGEIIHHNTTDDETLWSSNVHNTNIEQNKNEGDYTKTDFRSVREIEKPRGYKKILIAVSVAAVMIVAIILASKGGSKAEESSQGENVESAIISNSKHVTRQKCHVMQGNCSYTGSVNSDGVPDGEGEAWFNDGRHYKGHFSNGMMVDDDASFSYSNHDTYRGSFENDHFANGRYTVYIDKSYFIGSYDEQGQPKKGAWYDKNGKKIQDI